MRNTATGCCLVGTHSSKTPDLILFRPRPPRCFVNSLAFELCSSTAEYQCRHLPSQDTEWTTQTLRQTATITTEFQVPHAARKQYHCAAAADILKAGYVLGCPLRLTAQRAELLSLHLPLASRCCSSLYICFRRSNSTHIPPYSFSVFVHSSSSSLRHDPSLQVYSRQEA